MHNPFFTPIRKKRTEPRRTANVRLHGEDMTALRRQAFERSGGFCEATRVLAGSERWSLTGIPIVERCCRPITWESMELMHRQHGPRRSDTLADVLAGCKECHRNQHNAGGHPCPRRPGRVMKRREAETYWNGTQCLGCNQVKKQRESFCTECRGKLQPQTAHDLEHATGRDWAEALARGEMELLGKVA